MNGSILSEKLTSMPKVITKLYDQMRNDQTLLELKNGKSEKLTSVVKMIIPELGELDDMATDELINRKYKKAIFRIDVPFVTKELAFWHQDNFYVKGNSDELTVWIPLFTTKVQHGCLSVMPKSQKRKCNMDLYHMKLSLVKKSCQKVFMIEKSDTLKWMLEIFYFLALIYYTRLI